MLKIEAPPFFCTTIFRRGGEFAFYFDALAEIDQEACFDAGGFDIVDELGLMCGMDVLDGFQSEDDVVFHHDVGSIVAGHMAVVIDLDSFFYL